MRYRVMRLMVMFDLPVETSEQRREYRKFRKSLINEGLCMIQYSVYVRVCTTRQAATLLENRIKAFIPDEESGGIQTLILTEKQYGDMHFLLGKEKDDIRNSSERTIFI